MPPEQTEAIKHYITYNASQRLLQLYPEIMVLTQEDLDDLPTFLRMLAQPPYQIRIAKAMGHRMGNALVRQLGIRMAGRDLWNKTAMVPVLTDPKHGHRLSKGAGKRPLNSLAVQSIDKPVQSKKSKNDHVLAPAEMLGKRISIYWEDDEEYYDGKVVAFSGSRGQQVRYDDGEYRWYDLLGQDVQYTWLPPSSSSVVANFQQPRPRQSRQRHFYRKQLGRPPVVTVSARVTADGR